MEDYETPAKQGEHREPISTNLRDEEDRGISGAQESNIRQNEESAFREDQNNLLERMTKIQNQIQNLHQRLKNLNNARKNFKDKLSEQYLQLENERRLLKVDLINYDHSHLTLFTKYLRIQKEKEQRQIQQRNQKQKRQRQQRKQKLQKQQQQFKQKLQRSRKQYQEQLEKKKQQIEKEEQQIKQKILKDQKQIQENILERSRRKIRIQEIQIEIIEKNLRRSRQLILEEELAAIRSSYLYPYPYYRLRRYKAFFYDPLPYYYY